MEKGGIVQFSFSAYVLFLFPRVNIIQKEKYMKIALKSMDIRLK